MSSTPFCAHRFIGKRTLGAQWISKAPALGLIAVVLVAATVSAVASLWSSGPTPPLVNHASELTSQSNSDRNVTVLALQLRDGGFVPTELTLTPGNYEFVINNVSGERDITVQLSRARGETLESVPMKRGRNLRKLVRLTPGEYVLSVESHPTWATPITVTTP